MSRFAPELRNTTLALWLAVAATAGLSAAADGSTTLTHSLGAAVVAATCGPVLTDTFDLPDDATVTEARVHATLDTLNSTALGATVEVRAGAFVLASNQTAGGVGWLGASGKLDVGLLNAHLVNQTPAAGTVRLELVVAVCPDLGVAALVIDEATVVYARAPPNSTANASAVPPIVSVSVGGAVTTEVEAGAPLVLEPVANGTFGDGVEFAWFLDGALVGHGRVLANVSLAPGVHNITVRASDGNTTRTYAVRVSAAARPAPGGPSTYVLAGALGGLAVVGAAAARTETGRYLILGVALGSVFARLNKASLLDHFTRGTLYQVIRENPGIHFAELRRRTQLANGAASHHLRTLEKGGYVRVVIDGAKTRFFSTDRPLEADVYGVSNTDRAVLTAVTDSPGIGQGELAAKVARSQSAVSRSVSRLVALGYVTTTKDGARVQVFPRSDAPQADLRATPWPDEGA